MSLTFDQAMTLLRAEFPAIAKQLDAVEAADAALGRAIAALKPQPLPSGQSPRIPPDASLGGSDPYSTDAADCRGPASVFSSNEDNA